MKKNRKINYKSLIVIIICVIIILLLILAIMMVKNLLDVNQKNETFKEYNLDEINLAIYSKNLITDYNVFYTIENISNEVFELIDKGAYQDLCAIMDKEIVYNQSREEIVNTLKEYNKILQNSASITSHYLSYVYNYSDNMYLCKVNINDRLTSLLLRLDENTNTYKIVFIEKWS